MRKFYIALSILLLLNILLYAGVVSTNRKYRQVALYYNEANAIIENQKNQRQIQWYSQMAINEDVLYSEICNLRLHKYLLDSDTYMAVFIPPGFCGVCLDSVCESIAEMESTIKYPIVVLTPSFKYRDMYALFSKDKSVTLIEYNYETLIEENLSQTDRIILFRMGDNRIRNIVIIDKENPEWVRDYLIQ